MHQRRVLSKMDAMSASKNALNEVQGCHDWMSKKKIVMTLLYPSDSTVVSSTQIYRSKWNSKIDKNNQKIHAAVFWQHTRTHARTHTHPFNGSFSGTTRVSRYQKGKTNLDFTEARDSERQWHQLGHMQVCISLQTDNHTSTPPLKSFLQAGCPSCRPANSVKALKAKRHCKTAKN